MHPALEQLKAKAEGAMKGPWELERNSSRNWELLTSLEGRLVSDLACCSETTAQFIAAANPDTARKLIEVIALLRGALEMEGVVSHAAEEILNTLVQQ